VTGCTGTQLASGVDGMEYDAVNGLSGSVSHWTTIQGIRMHARRWYGPSTAGSTPILLVHGLAVSSRYFAPLAVRLARRFEVYAPDLPGWGRSDKPRGVRDLPELADVLAGWMRANELTPAVLVGNSMGCQLITHLAAAAPDLVAGVALVGPTMDRHARTLAHQAWRLFRDMLREPPWTWALHTRDLLDFGLCRTIAMARLAIDDRPEDRLPLVRVPALVVRGERDAIVSRRWAGDVARLLPDGSLAELPGAAHAANSNSPDELAALLTPFIDDVVRADASGSDGLAGRGYGPGRRAPSVPDWVAA
jgi:2-hydroxy-6-oxonona-2,4-dienedioate hydrolase